MPEITRREVRVFSASPSKIHRTCSRTINPLPRCLICESGSLPAMLSLIQQQSHTPLDLVQYITIRRKRFPLSQYHRSGTTCLVTINTFIDKLLDLQRKKYPCERVFFFRATTVIVTCRYLLRYLHYYFRFKDILGVGRVVRIAE